MQLNETTMNRLLICTIFVFVVLNLLCINLNAQQKLNFNIGYELHESWWEGQKDERVIKACIKYRFINIIESGIELGHTRFNNQQSATFNQNVLYYALRLNLQLAPLIFKAENPKLDVYLSGKYGGYHVFFGELWSNYYSTVNYPDYGGYLGVKVPVFKFLGVYAEGGFGNLSNFQFGLNFTL
jgi:hypothetical protein